MDLQARGLVYADAVRGQAFRDMHPFEQGLVLRRHRGLRYRAAIMHAAAALVASGVAHGGRAALLNAVLWSAVSRVPPDIGDGEGCTQVLVDTVCKMLCAESDDMFVAFRHDVFVWDLCVFHNRCTSAWDGACEGAVGLSALRKELHIARKGSNVGGLEGTLSKLLRVYFAPAMLDDEHSLFDKESDAPCQDGFTVPPGAGTRIAQRASETKAFSPRSCAQHEDVVRVFLRDLRAHWATERTKV